MKLPNSEHTSRPWRFHELTWDFRLEDVWALPTPSLRDDFTHLVHWLASRDHPVRSSGSARVRALWAARLKAGRVLGRYRPASGVGSRVSTLCDRLPPDLRAGPAGPKFLVPTRTPLDLPSSRRRSGAIRASAKEQGIAVSDRGRIPVSDRGRIPVSVIERYQAATSSC